MFERYLGDLYTDPAPPDPPEEIFGFPTEPALRLGEALDRMRLASGGTFGDSGRLVIGAVTLFPLVERIQAGETVTPAEVRPYRESIKEVSSFVGKTDHLIDLLGLFPPAQIPFRVLLNTQLERRFARHVGKALEQGAELVPRFEPYAQLVAGFAEPRAEFVEEIRLLHDAVLEAAGTRRGGSAPRPREAAAGIAEVLGPLVEKPETRSELPLLAGLLALRQTRGRPLRLPSESVLAIAAPEIITMLGAPLPEADQEPDLVGALRLGQKTAAPAASGLEALRAAAPALLPGMRDLLPATGAEAAAGLKAVQAFLSPPA